MKVWGFGAGLTSADLNGNFAEVQLMMPPIGSIIPFYDYNGALTFNTTYYAYCNGQTKTIAGSSRVLPDLSNRYLVGFGTEGGADIGTAAWATAAVGNTSHQVSLAHTHTGPSHTHTGPSHTHSFSDSFSGITAGSAPSAYFINNGQVDHAVASSGHTHAFSGSVSGTTGSGGTGNTGAGGTGNTGAGGSATQSIQPRSISVRFIMRIL